MIFEIQPKFFFEIGWQLLARQAWLAITINASLQLMMSIKIIEVADIHHCPGAIDQAPCD